MQKWLLAAAALLAFSTSAADPALGARLAEAITTEDAARKSELIRSFVEANDPYVKQVLEAWRGGLVQLYDSGGTNVPVLLESETDSEGRAKAKRVSDGEFIKDAAGTPMLFGNLDLTPADASSKLRKQIKVTLDIFSLVHPNPKMRRDAVIKLGQEQNPDYLPFFQERLSKDNSEEVQKALHEAVAVTQIASSDAKLRVPAIEKLGELRSINSLTFLKSVNDSAKTAPEKFDKETIAACSKAINDIEQYIWLGNLFGTAFRGLSLSAVLLVAALGLAITFGLMGVINMAHGEIIMIGAYATYVTQNVFRTWAATNPAIQD